MNPDKVNLEDYFTYHPPVTEERITKHQNVNDACLILAGLFLNYIKDEQCRVKAIESVQLARFYANQGITLDELRELKAK